MKTFPCRFFVCSFWLIAAVRLGANPVTLSPSARWDGGLAQTLVTLKPQGYNVSSFTTATPSTSYPSAGGYTGFISAMHAQSYYEYYYAYYAGSGTPAGTTGSAITAVSSKALNGNFSIGGYGDTSTGYRGYSSTGHFTTDTNGGPIWLGTPVPIAGLPAGTIDSNLTGWSAGGAAATGFYLNSSFTSVPLVISPIGSAPILLPLPAGVTSGEKPVAISANGTVIVGNNLDPFGGTSQSGSCTLTYYSGGTYTAQSIGKYPGSVATYASGISADGTTVSGSYFDAQGSSHPMIWAANVFTDIGASAPAGSKFGQAYASTADGTTVVGYAPSGTNAFSWTAKGGMQTLPTLTGEATSVAECVSSDGEFIGGASYDANFTGYGIAQIWTASGNTYNLRTALAVMGVDTSAWQFLSQVTAIVANSDGSYLFVGNGIHNGSPEGFIFELGFLPVTAPTILTQPAAQTVKAGASVTFIAAASDASATYQWKFNGTAISGATSASYTIAAAAAANVGSYTVTATNAGGAATSSGAVLAVQTTGAPAIGIQPQSQTMAAGSTLALTVNSTRTVTVNSSAGLGVRSDAATPLSYQWYLNGVAISGATSATLFLPNVSSANAGSYACLVSNASGSTLSNAAVVTVTTTANPGRLVNLSVLSVVQGSLTMGYVIGGSGTVGSETVLIRATGPALAAPPFGIPGTMVDPTLTVVKQAGSVTIATNTGWGATTQNQQQVTAADAAVGAFALTNPSSLDSALVTSLPVSGGGYTATVAAKTGGSGYALTEVYDATPAGTYTITTPRLVNLSCLTSIGAGGTLTVGFVVGGSTAKTVLVRVSGPTLAVAPFGIGGTMTDPMLSVQPLSSATTILAANQGWGGDAQIASAAATVGAFALSSPSSLDSAALVTLAAGVPYTVQVNSASGGGGLVLVEIYEVP